MTKAFLLSLFKFPLLHRHGILDHILPYKFLWVNICVCVLVLFLIFISPSFTRFGNWPLVAKVTLDLSWIHEGKDKSFLDDWPWHMVSDIYLWVYPGVTTAKWESRTNDQTCWHSLISEILYVKFLRLLINSFCKGNFALVKYTQTEFPLFPTYAFLNSDKVRGYT